MAYRVIEINKASFNLIIFCVNNVFLLFFKSSVMSFVWFQKFDAALETRETNIPEINKFNFETEISVKLQEIRNNVKEKIGIGEIIEYGEKKSFIIPRIFVLTSDIFFHFL